MQPETRLQTAFRKVAVAIEELGHIIDEEAAAMKPKKTKLTKREVVSEILAANPQGMDIHALMDAMRKKGYHFTGASPLNAVRSWLYKQPEFQCQDGIFAIRKPEPAAEMPQN